MLDQVDEDQIPAGHHEVAQSHDGPLKHPNNESEPKQLQERSKTQRLKERTHLSDSQPRRGELREQTAEDGGVEVHQQTPLSAETQRAQNRTSFSQEVIATRRRLPNRLVPAEHVGHDVERLQLHGHVFLFGDGARQATRYLLTNAGSQSRAWDGDGKQKSLIINVFPVKTVSQI